MPALTHILEILDRDDALELVDPPTVWPSLDSEDEVYELDWTRLFPRRVTDRGAEEWDLYGDDGWALPDDVLERISGGGRGQLDVSADGRTPPGWDRCAWYQPIHFYGPAWGIFVYDQCLIDVAAALYLVLGAPPMSDRLGRTLLRSAFAILFLHEQYHHKTESLAIRLHVIEQTRRYVPYFKNVYMPSAGTDDQIEEGLANADSYHRLADDPYRSWLPGRIREATKEYLSLSFRVAPPGYRIASTLLDRADFDALENVLEAQVQEASLTPTRTATEDFGVATHLNQSLFQIRQNIWTIAAKGRSPLLPAKPTWIAPLSRHAIERFLATEGYEPAKGRGKGSHRVYKKTGTANIVLPDQKDLSPVVLRNTAHALGLRNARELAEAIRK